MTRSPWRRPEHLDQDDYLATFFSTGSEHGLRCEAVDEAGRVNANGRRR